MGICLYRQLHSILLLAVLILSACKPDHHLTEAPENKATEKINENFEFAIFAGGCFWCTESDFDKLPGVLSTISGYIGGTAANPTYEQVSSGVTGHIEAVKVTFDNTQTNFSKLLEAFWQTIDPLTPNQQFCDVGPQYRSAIFYYGPSQKKIAEASKKALETSRQFTQPIATEILPVSEFYPAEEYHQNYYIRNPLRYAYYRKSCGRDKRLEELWGIKY